MTIQMSPYLNFPPGQTREAMETYQRIFGGSLHIVTFADFGFAEMPADGVMHAALTHEHFKLYASDAMPGAEVTWGGTRNYIAFMGDEIEVLRGWFEALAEGGHVGTPLDKQVWGDFYGQVTDRFGIEWMFNVSEPS